MRIVKQATMLAGVLAVLAGGRAEGVTPPQFQALGWLAGEAQISEQGIRCQIPTVAAAITDGSFQMGLWNTFGEPTILFPNPNAGFANPCGGWMQLQNNLIDQGMMLERIVFRYKIPGARRFRQFVPTRKNFPVACRDLRRETRFMSARLNAANSNSTTPAGAPNVAIVNPVPMVNTALIHCLRGQYAPLPTDVYTSLPLVIRAQAFGTTDLGEAVTSNVVLYSLTLRHLCGNGRLDDGEFCDPAGLDSCFDLCLSGACQLSGAPCLSSRDCGGVCLPANDPEECNCAF